MVPRRSRKLFSASRAPNNGRHRPGAISRFGQLTKANHVALCGKCSGCGLELAFPPVEATEIGGWIAYWPHGQGGALVYRRTCRACDGLGVTKPAANLSS